MNYLIRLFAALGVAVVLVLGIHTLSQPGLAAFVPHGWNNHGPVTPENPLVVDKDAGTVRVYARVNGKYLYLPTRHGMNYRDGRIGDKALFRAWANPIDFRQALVAIGADPGQNLDGSTGGQIVDGAPMAISVDWRGAAHPYALDTVVSDADGEGVAFRFGGNVEIPKKARTGCLMCFDSCPVGITSNSRYPQGSFHKRGLAFRGRPEVLPPGGTPVTVTFRVAKS